MGLESGGVGASDGIAAVSPEMESIFGPTPVGQTGESPPAAPGRPQGPGRSWAVKIAGLSAVGLLGILGGMLISTAFDGGAVSPHLSLLTPGPRPLIERAAGALSVAAPLVRQPADGPATLDPPQRMLVARAEAAPAIHRLGRPARSAATPMRRRAPRQEPQRTSHWPYSPGQPDPDVRAPAQDDLGGLY